MARARASGAALPAGEVPMPGEGTASSDASAGRRGGTTAVPVQVTTGTGAPVALASGDEAAANTDPAHAKGERAEARPDKGAAKPEGPEARFEKAAGTAEGEKGQAKGDKPDKGDKGDKADKPERARRAA